MTDEQLARHAARQAKRRAAKEAKLSARAVDPDAVTLADIAARLERLEQLSAETLRVRTRMRQDTARAIRTLGRLLEVPADELPYPQRLTVQRFGLESQGEEDGITLALLREAGIGPRRFVEIGCGANGGNSGFLATELGFSGLMVDADEIEAEISRHLFNRARVEVVNAFVTAETVGDLVGKHGCSGELDVLSIDIDGNDAWIWQALQEVVDPRIVIVEFNVLMGPDRAVIIPYDAEFDRHILKPIYFGVSLAGVAALGRRFGHRLVATTPNGQNAFLLRDDLAPHIPEATVAELWTLPRKLLRKRGERYGRAGDPVGEFYSYVESAGLPLVDLAD